MKDKIISVYEKEITAAVTDSKIAKRQHFEIITRLTPALDELYEEQYSNSMFLLLIAAEGLRFLQHYTGRMTIGLNENKPIGYIDLYSPFFKFNSLGLSSIGSLAQSSDCSVTIDLESNGKTQNIHISITTPLENTVNTTSEIFEALRKNPPFMK